MTVGKFDAVPLDSDTALLFSMELKLEDRDLLYQKWIWDGIMAESFIFVTADVAGLADEELEAFCRISPMIEKQSTVTLARARSGFDFVNFNFKILEDEE